MSYSNKYRFLCCITLILLAVPAHPASPLKGEIIGTRQSVDYATGAVSDTINSIQNVFDDNFYAG